MSRSWPVLAAVGLALVATAGCGTAGGQSSRSQDATVTVFAAASLSPAFEQIAAEFESGHEGVQVALNFAGSSGLAAQIQEGAPADVFASADEETMDELAAAGLTGTEPRLFAANTLRIVVPPGNPADVQTFADLAAPRLNLVVCAPEVPCGAATQRVADLAGVDLSPVSEEQSVTDVLAKVATGEADAGVVYVTDVRAAGDDVEGIGIPEASSVVNRYPIATVAGSESAGLAQAFVDLVLAETGQSILRSAGFAAAP